MRLWGAIIQGMSLEPKYPIFYRVDDIAVRIDKRDDGEVEGTNHIGNGYSPMKALIEGVRITQEEFNRFASAKSASL